MFNCENSNCGQDLERALQKIREDEKCRPTCCVGPTDTYKSVSE